MLFRSENRSHGYVDLVLPRTIDLTRADDADRLVVEVTFSPAAPILGPGEEVKLEMKLLTENRTVLSSTPEQVFSFYGTVVIGSRGGLQVGVPLCLKVLK